MIRAASGTSLGCGLTLEGPWSGRAGLWGAGNSPCCRASDATDGPGGGQKGKKVSVVPSGPW